MSVFLIPLQNYPQVFEIALAGAVYNMTVYWNDAIDGGWTMDLADAVTGESVAAGLPLITGGDVLAGLGYLGIGGSLIVYTDGDEFAEPTFDNLGVESNMYFVTGDA